MPVDCAWNLLLIHVAGLDKMLDENRFASPFAFTRFPVDPYVIIHPRRGHLGSRAFPSAKPITLGWLQIIKRRRDVVDIHKEKVN